MSENCHFCNKPVDMDNPIIHRAHADCFGKQVIMGSIRNPWMNQILSKIAALHDKKNHDYAPDDDVFYNFKVGAAYAGISVLQDFNALLGTKLARLHTLMTRPEGPNNESFIDSEWDYVVYFLLREAWKLTGEK